MGMAWLNERTGRKPLPLPLTGGAVRGSARASTTDWGPGAMGQATAAQRSPFSLCTRKPL